MALHMKKKLGFTKLTERIIGHAISVHKELGPGFLEKIYEHALCLELDNQGVSYRRQVGIPITYRGRPCGLHRLDLIIEDRVIVELKATKSFEAIHFAVILSYLKASHLPVALLLNFAEPTLAIRRFGNRILQNGENRNPGKGGSLVKFLREEGH